MKIAVAGGKGGTGKSTIATIIAAELGVKAKTMLIDCDVECPNDHLLLNTKLKFYKDVFQVIPKWDQDICNKCGKCAEICKQDAIIFVEGKFPAFLAERCIGCKACLAACPLHAISTDQRPVGKIYLSDSKKYNITLVTGELNIGDLASGEIVAELRKESKKINLDKKCEHIVTDAAAGIGCPVIASILNNDYMIAVTEPTPSAFSDLKRVISLATHFNIPIGIVINKYDINEKFIKEIEKFADCYKIKIVGKIPYDKNLIKLNVEGKISDKSKYKEIIKKLLSNIEETI
ncbi:MAG: ATP-binding protein [Patescibacteria group bacterium]|jgi:MinD superfamily P-loop ATPase